MPHKKEKSEEPPAVAISLSHATKPARTRSRQAKAACDDLEKALRATAQSKQFYSVKGGLCAEHVHAGTFNANAAQRGRPELRAVVGSPGNNYADPQVDIRIQKKGKTLSTAQLKYSGTPEETGSL
jgi:hypothetical protein